MDVGRAAERVVKASRASVSLAPSGFVAVVAPPTLMPLMASSIHSGALRLAGLSALGASPDDATAVSVGGKTAGVLII